MERGKVCLNSLCSEGNSSRQQPCLHTAVLSWLSKTREGYGHGFFMVSAYPSSANTIPPEHHIFLPAQNFSFEMPLNLLGMAAISLCWLSKDFESHASTDLDPRQLCPSTGESPSKGGTLDHLVYIPRTQPLCSLFWVLKARASSRRQTLTGVSSLGFSVLTPRFHRLTPKSIVLPFKIGQA